MKPQINVTQYTSPEKLTTQLQDLMQKLEEVEEEKNSYETLLEIITQHSTDLENQMRDKNREMQTYIQQVKKVIDAAIAVKNNCFEPQILSDVAARSDALGELAQVFSHMVETVKAREQELEKLLQGYGRFIPDEYLQFLGKQSIVDFQLGDHVSKEMAIMFSDLRSFTTMAEQDRKSGSAGMPRSTLFPYTTLFRSQFLGKQSIVDFQLGDHVSKEMAIMFSDLRSFTTMAEQMTPQENFDFINSYLQRISPEIRNHNGFIVKYMGDGVMAVFPEGVDDAIQAGIVMLEQLQEYNQSRQINGYIPLNIGIGIHVGDTMVGIIGEANRMQADALSDHVNITARLESLTKYYGVSLLISGDVVERLSQPEKYHIRFLDRAIVKGRQR